ncbi:SemiSWEET transporter [Cupriavidus sp. AcVe19-6a]|uniref:SemiSWEET transporter n=1 Tax=Cupriavidus sp. AcVe19-6a TaxID=2821358 RepID=UPI001AE212CE|nr:SemiSWEET transporter [Cupriavidus sp. AcVe19-6a]MBP0639917.1 SemiSWEET transporter [Cupriavidus sp. AcVe19-6a]
MVALNLLDGVGLVAAALTTGAFVPQLLKVWRSRSAADISYGMYVAFIAGVLLWLGYGVAIGSMPMVVSNAAVLLQAIAIVVLKRRFEA